MCHCLHSPSPAFRSTWSVWTSAGCGPLTSSSPSGPVAFRRSASVQRRTAWSASGRSGPAFPDEICERTSCGKDGIPNYYSIQEVSLKHSHLPLYVRKETSWLVFDRISVSACVSVSVIIRISVSVLFVVLDLIRVSLLMLNRTLVYYLVLVIIRISMFISFHVRPDYYIGFNAERNFVICFGICAISHSLVSSRIGQLEYCGGYFADIL